MALLIQNFNTASCDGARLERFISDDLLTKQPSPNPKASKVEWNSSEAYGELYLLEMSLHRSSRRVGLCCWVHSSPDLWKGHRIAFFGEVVYIFDGFKMLRGESIF